MVEKRCKKASPQVQHQVASFPIWNTNIGFVFQNWVNTMFGCGHWYSIIKKIMESQLWEEITLERGLSKNGQNHKNSQNPNLPPFWSERPVSPFYPSFSWCGTAATSIFLNCHLFWPIIARTHNHHYCSDQDIPDASIILEWNTLQYTIYIFWEIGEL